MIETLVAVQCESGWIDVNLDGRVWSSQVSWSQFVEAARLAGFVESTEPRLAGVFRGTRTRRTSLAA